MYNFISKNSILLIAIFVFSCNASPLRLFSKPNFVTDYGISFYFEESLPLQQDDVETWTSEVIAYWAKKGINKNDAVSAILRAEVIIVDVDKFVINGKSFRSYIYPYTNEMHIASRPPSSDNQSSIWKDATSLQIVKSAFYHELSLAILGSAARLWGNDETMYLLLEEAGW